MSMLMVQNHSLCIKDSCVGNPFVWITYISACPCMVVLSNSADSYACPAIRKLCQSTATTSLACAGM